jgi:hypothetical protein
MTGLTVGEFEALVDDLAVRYARAEKKRLSRPNRQRAMGAGHPMHLALIDQILFTIVWLRLYPTHEVLGYLFDVSDSTARRAIERMLPLLEQSGQDTMRLPDPGKRQHRQLDVLLADLPELMVIVDSFEQRVQRPMATIVARSASIHSRVKSPFTSKPVKSSMCRTVSLGQPPISNYWNNLA